MHLNGTALAFASELELIGIFLLEDKVLNPPLVSAPTIISCLWGINQNRKTTWLGAAGCIWRHASPFLRVIFSVTQSPHHLFERFIVHLSISASPILHPTHCHSLLHLLPNSSWFRISDPISFTHLPRPFLSSSRDETPLNHLNQADQLRAIHA